MKRLIILFAIILTSNFIFGQLIIKGGVNFQHFPQHESKESFEYTLTGSPNLIDSYFISIKKRTTLVKKTQFLSETGCFGGIDFRQKISKKLQVETGINFNLSKFEYRDSSWLENTHQISIDTTFFETPPEVNFGPSCFLSPEISGQIDRRKFMSINHLVIPLKLNYKVIQNEFNLSIGGYVATTLNSKFRTQFIDIEIIDTTQLAECKAEIIHYKINDGRLFSNLNFGISIGADYWVGNYGFEFFIDKRLTNLFAKEGDVNVRYSRIFEARTKPFFANFMFKYKIHIRNKHSLPPPEYSHK